MAHWQVVSMATLCIYVSSFLSRAKAEIFVAHAKSLQPTSAASAALDGQHRLEHSYRHRRGRAALGQYERELLERKNEEVQESTAAVSTKTVSSGSLSSSLTQEIGVSVASKVEWPEQRLAEHAPARHSRIASLIPFSRKRKDVSPVGLKGGSRDSDGRGNNFSVQLDSVWTLRIGKWLAATLSTGRILGSVAALILLPMTLIQRLVSAGYTAGQDWYTGYYIRTTLQKMEQQYTRQYQVPACLRSMGRLLTQWIMLSVLGVVMEWMVGLSHAPCAVSSGGLDGIGGGAGCHWWCGMLWIVAVIGPGHLCGVAVAIWVRGLRIQVAPDDNYQHRPSGRRLVTRPGALVRWMLDPGQWFREIIARDRTTESALKPFDPGEHWLMFPATWRSLRVLQMVAVAKEMYGSDSILRALMRNVIWQQALGDEWYRVLMIERRVAWSIFLMVGYTLSTLGLFWNMVQKPAHSVSTLSLLFTLPSMMAVFISGWMNVLVYFDRRQHVRPLGKDDKDPVQEAIQQYKRVTVPLPRDRV
jgi:hypothetical protein